MNRLIAAVLCLAPAVLAAQGTPIHVSDPDACAYTVDVDPELGPYRVITEGGASVLYPWGLEGVEYSCEWETEIELGATDADTLRQIRPGYCVAAEHVTPTVFVIESYAELPGRVRIWQQGADMPEDFFACPG